MLVSVPRRNNGALFPHRMVRQSFSAVVARAGQRRRQRGSLATENLWPNTASADRPLPILVSWSTHESGIQLQVTPIFAVEGWVEIVVANGSVALQRRFCHVW